MERAAPARDILPLGLRDTKRGGVVWFGGCGMDI